MPHFAAELIPAMVTPFRPDESIDFPRFEQLAVHLVENGCDGLLVNGTTGEGPTLDFEEKIDLLRAARQAVSGKAVQMMAAIGGNDTRKSVEEARKVARLGVDALLVVVPYYNKPTQAGMIEHFTRIAQAVETEIVIYNIPSRCVVRMEAQTMAQLHTDCPNIIGVKQSCPDMDAVSEIAALLPADTWRTWCGDDSLTLPMLSLGAHGTISVLAHLAGNHLRALIRLAKAGKREQALALHLQLLTLSRELFFLPNPTVVKTALARLGMMEPTLRPPMVSPNAEDARRIEAFLTELKALDPVGV